MPMDHRLEWAAQEGKTSEVLTLLREHSDAWQPVCDATGREQEAVFNRTQVLCFAASGNQIETMQALLEIGADVNAPGPRRHRALCIAARESKLDTVKWLIKHGADPRLPDCRGMAIDQARSWNKQSGVLEYLESVNEGTATSNDDLAS
jgi:hypothetical protein